MIITNLNALKVRRFMNYIEHLQKYGHQLNERQIYLAAKDYGLTDAFEVNFVLDFMAYETSES